MCGHLEVVKCFIDKKGVDASVQTGMAALFLHSAAEGNRLGVVKYLIDKGVDVNVQDKSGKTPLYIANCYENKDLVSLLLDKGADVDLQDGNDRVVLYTTLHLRSRYYGAGCIKLLIAHKIKLQDFNAEKPEYLQDPDTNLKRSMSKY
ncbi:MAG: ankyrin repeat domain-containing protein [Wolbachia sp.]